MSTAYYPQGMRTMPASGRMNSSFPSQYTTWKGTGILSNPVAIAPSHIRPLTNKDSGNVFQSGSYPKRYPQFTRRFFPRPLKHHRRGRVIPPNSFENQFQDNPTFEMQTDLINYNVNRYVSSSKGTSVGNGRYSYGMVTYTQDIPGGYTVKENVLDEVNGEQKLNNDCKTCEGVGLVVNYMPNNTYLTNNPEPRSQSAPFCCNEQYKAKRRAIYASTNLKKNYYTTNFEYLQNRCQTFNQKSFNFQDNKGITSQLLLEDGFTPEQIESAKPGSALSQLNIYEANCYPNAEIFEATENAILTKIANELIQSGIYSQKTIDNLLVKFTAKNKLKQFINFTRDLSGIQLAKANEIIDRQLSITNTLGGPIDSSRGCKLTVYKPNNPQFAKQGAVSSSTRLLKLNVDTISTNAASMNKNNNIGSQLYTANELYKGNDTYNANLYKNKSQSKCTAPPPALIQGRYPYQNKKQCAYNKELPDFRLPISQPSPYRYYPGTVFSTNHYSQTPRTYNNTTQNITV